MRPTGIGAPYLGRGAIFCAFVSVAISKMPRGACCSERGRVRRHQRMDQNPPKQTASGLGLRLRAQHARQGDLGRRNWPASHTISVRVARPDSNAQRRDTAGALGRDRRASTTLDDSRRAHEGKTRSCRAPLRTLPGDSETRPRTVPVPSSNLSGNEVRFAAVQYDIYEGVEGHGVCDRSYSARNEERLQGLMCRSCQSAR